MIKVLVVEDDPMVSKLHEHYLNQLNGFQLVDAVRNSDDALTALKNKNYDLIILDIFMPGIDGLQLLSKIRELNYDTDVIIVSAANDKDKIKTALRLGAFDYIIKPFEFDRFSVALNNYKNRYELVGEQDILEQSELDKTIIRQNNDGNLTIPKGLDKNTLHTVWQEIIKLDDMFTTEEISASVGISRVSIRKYLEFLKSLNVLILELNRGCVGRPVYKYKCIDRNINLINSYLK
ncbi:MAG: response regulator [Acidaminococcaceae bacterium]